MSKDGNVKYTSRESRRSQEPTMSTFPHSNHRCHCELDNLLFHFASSVLVNPEEMKQLASCAFNKIIIMSGRNLITLC